MLATRKAALITYYSDAKRWITNSPYAAEIEWQRSVSQHKFSETRFLREYAWVVLNSGFRESVVRRYFDYISLCFCDWESAEDIVKNEIACITAAESVFKNRRKLNAIATTAKYVHTYGFSQLRRNFSNNPINALIGLPFIGNTTVWHLAKNLGANVAKPDRHLMRLAMSFGYHDVGHMCRDIEDEIGDCVAVADLVLWRHEAQHRCMRVARKVTA